MADGNIAFNASLNTAGFDSGAKHLQNVASSASGAITQHFGKIATAVIGIGAAFMGARAAAQAFNAAIAMGGQLNDLSARTGESAGNLAILQRAFQNAGAGADAVGPTINRLQRAIIEAGEGGKQQAEAFAKLGLSFADIRNLSPTEQLQAVAKALQGVSNDSDRSAIAMQLLGRSGGELLPLLRAMGTELDVARGQLGSLPGVIDRTNAHLDAIGDNFAAIGEKGKEFMVGFLEKVAPALADLTTRMANIDAAGFGAKLSEYAEKTGRWIVETFKLGDALNNIELAIKGITSGDFGKGFELLFVTARITASNAINQIVAMAMAGMNSIATFLVETLGPGSAAFRIIKNGFDVLATQIGISLSTSIVDSLKVVADIIPNIYRDIGGKLAQSILPGVAAVGEGMKKLADAFDTSPIAESISNTVNKSINWAKDDVAMLMSWIKEDVGELGKEFGDAGKKLPENFAQAYESYAKSPLIDLTSALAEQKQLSADLAENIKAAGVNAEAFAAALEKAKSSPFSPIGSNVGGDEDASPFPDFTRGGGVSFPAPDPSETKTDAGGSSSRSSGPQTAFGKLSGMAKDFDKAAMRDIGRITDRAGIYQDKATDYASRGMHGAAANAAAKAEQIRQQEAAKALERMGKNGAKPEAQRKREAEAAADGDSGAASSGDPVSDIYNWLKDTFLTEFKERLPQTAMTT
jgi:hypothetical protein